MKQEYYFCGAGKVALEVKAKLGKMIMESNGYSEEEAAKTLEQLSRAARFAADNFDRFTMPVGYETRSETASLYLLRPQVFLYI